MHMAKFNVENNQKTMTGRILQYTVKREGWGLNCKGCLYMYETQLSFTIQKYTEGISRHKNNRYVS